MFWSNGKACWASGLNSFTFQCVKRRKSTQNRKLFYGSIISQRRNIYPSARLLTSLLLLLEAHSYRQDDPTHLLDRHQQTTVFRLGTGHCLLRAHMQRLGLSHTENCPCDAGQQTPEHVLQSCPLHAEARLQQWPIWTTLADKLWGSKEDLMTTTNFINGTGLRMYSMVIGTQKKKLTSNKECTHHWFLQSSMSVQRHLLLTLPCYSHQ